MLRQLIKDGLIAGGDVDERSITEVRPDDIKGYTQCHFFAGIGGWSVALRLAGWDDSRPVWTGSCPCQPFSSAGKQKGSLDERHLWPAWYRLIRESKPATIFGEQVASAITDGWWDNVAIDLENENYTCGAAVLPACSIGFPHKRDRLWFVGNSQSAGKATQQEQKLESRTVAMPSGNTGNVASDVGNAKHGGRNGEKIPTQQRKGIPLSAGAGATEHVANTIKQGLEGHRGHEQEHGSQGRKEQDGHTGAANLQWIECPDGKARPVKRGIRLLAHGVQHRTPILHALGNAIVPEVAAKFIEASGAA